MNAIDMAIAADFKAIFGGKKPAGLLHLSVTPDGKNPTNDERARLLRSRLSSPTYNSHVWPNTFHPSATATPPQVAGGLEPIKESQ